MAEEQSVAKGGHDLTKPDISADLGSFVRNEEELNRQLRRPHETEVSVPADGGRSLHEGASLGPVVINEDLTAKLRGFAHQIKLEHVPDDHNNLSPNPVSAGEIVAKAQGRG